MMTKPPKEDRVRLNSWECALIRRALATLGDRSDWKSATDHYLVPHLVRLSTKIAREQDRQAQRGN
jgi:hypothetical protein